MKMVDVYFRYDDYTEVSNTDIELKLFKMFEKFGVNCLTAITPFWEENELGDAKADLLHKYITTDIVTPALHGLNHQQHAKGKGEFQGLDFESQLFKIKTGKNFLEEKLKHKVDCFVPPWNKYDQNTLEILKDLKFKLISATLNGGKGYTISEIINLPSTTALHYLEDSINYALKSNDPNPSVIVLFHSYQIIDSKERLGANGMNLKNIENLLNRLQKNKSVRFSNWNEKKQEDAKYNFHRFNYNFNYFQKSQTKFGRLKPNVPHVYWSYQNAQDTFTNLFRFHSIQSKYLLKKILKL